MEMLGPIIDVIASLFNFFMIYFAQGWVGYKIIFWGSTVVVYLCMVVGIGHTVLEGIFLTGMYVACGMIIMKLFLHIFPIHTMVVVGAYLLFFIGWVRVKSEEAPLQEKRRREAEEQRIRDKEEARRREEERQAYDEYIASLPVAAPKADLKECIENFRTYLNSVWNDLPSSLFEPNEDVGYIHIHTWLQRKFDRWVEKPLGLQISHSYGDWDADYAEELPWDEEPIVRKKPESKPMEIYVNGKYGFCNLVSLRDGWHYVEPPFDHVLVDDYDEAGQSPRERYIPLSEAHFELRPISIG